MKATALIAKGAGRRERIGNANFGRNSRMPSEEEGIIIATVKWVAHAAAVQGRQQVAPAGMLDCRTVVAMDVAGRPLLWGTIAAPAPVDE